MQDVSSNPRFTVFGTYREAWKLVKGVKWTIWATALVILLIAAVTSLIPLFLIGREAASFVELSSTQKILFAVFYFIGMAVIIPGAFAALGKITIERARNNPISIKIGLRAFWSRLLPVLFTFIFAYAIIIVPAIILVALLHIEPTMTWGLLFVVYAVLVGTCLSLSLFLAIDKTNNPFAAIYRSFKATWPHFYRVLGLIILNELIGLALQIPIQIGSVLGSEALTVTGFIVMLIAMIWIIPLQ
ncbi:MAG: hypothetical protein SFW07_06335, partial [Gammaproteobacteria bacterium]|nr:hypothetical protein [Gammaproteobacteria bacterium]